MAKFQYKAKKGPKDLVEGIIEADNLDGAVKGVVNLGLSPIEVIPAKEIKKAPAQKKIDLKAPGLLSKISGSSIVLLTRQLSDLADASVPLLRSLDLVRNQTKHPRLKSIVEQLYDSVRDGSNLSDALEKHPDVFSNLYVNMVRSGEVSGKLSLVLNRLADLYEKDQDVRNKIQTILVYPLFILAFGFLTVFFLLAFVIPRMSVLFEGLNQALPLPTLILINLSGFFSKFWWAVVIVSGLVVYYTAQWVKTSAGKTKLDSIKIKTPILSKYIISVEIGRFARILGTLLESGVVIVSALNSVWAVLDNTVLKEEIKTVADKVKNGSSLRAALMECRYFPEVAVDMVAVGEETGYLEKGLYKLADTYERQSDHAMRRFIALFGPTVLAIVIGIVGFVVAALLLPILEMNLIVA